MKHWFSPLNIGVTILLALIVVLLTIGVADAIRDWAIKRQHRHIVDEPESLPVVEQPEWVPAIGQFHLTARDPDEGVVDVFSATMPSIINGTVSVLCYHFTQESAKHWFVAPAANSK